MFGSDVDAACVGGSAEENAELLKIEDVQKYVEAINKVSKTLTPTDRCTFHNNEKMTIEGEVFNFGRTKTLPAGTMTFSIERPRHKNDVLKVVSPGKTFSANDKTVTLSHNVALDEFREGILKPHRRLRPRGYARDRGGGE